MYCQEITSPLIENQKVRWFIGFLISSFLRFLVSWFLGLFVSGFLGSKLSKSQDSKITNCSFHVFRKILIPCSRLSKINQTDLHICLVLLPPHFILWCPTLEISKFYNFTISNYQGFRILKFHDHKVQTFKFYISSRHKRKFQNIGTHSFYNFQNVKSSNCKN